MTTVDIKVSETTRNSLVLPNGEEIRFLKVVANITEKTYAAFELLNMATGLNNNLYPASENKVQEIINKYKITKKLIENCKGFEYQKKRLQTYMDKKGIQFWGE